MIAAVLFAAALTVQAPPPAAPAQGKALGNVIVTAGSKALLPKEVKVLGSSRGTVWASWPAEAASLAAAAEGSPLDSGLFLAYLDEGEFRRETEGLKGPQVAEVMRKRRAEPAQYLPDLAEGLAIGIGRIGAWLGIPAALEIHREGYFTGRFLLGNSEDMEGLLRDEVRIRGLERELASRADCPPAVADRFRKRDTAAMDAKLAQAASALGMTNANQKRWDASKRILYSREIFPWLAPLVESHDFVVEKTAHGYLIPQTPAEIAKRPPIGHSMIAFLDPAASARAVRLLTPAQLDHRIAALAAQGGLTARGYLAELVDARLTMLAILGKAMAPAAGQSGPGNPPARAALEAAYTVILDEARQAATDLLGPADTAAGKDRLEALRLRILILGKFAAPSGNKALIAWARNSAAALEARP